MESQDALWFFLHSPILSGKGPDKVRLSGDSARSAGGRCAVRKRIISPKKGEEYDTELGSLQDRKALNNLCCEVAMITTVIRMREGRVTDEEIVN